MWLCARAMLRFKRRQKTQILNSKMYQKRIKSKIVTLAALRVFCSTWKRLRTRPRAQNSYLSCAASCTASSKPSSKQNKSEIRLERNWRNLKEIVWLKSKILRTQQFKQQRKFLLPLLEGVCHHRLLRLMLFRLLPPKLSLSN